MSGKFEENELQKTHSVVIDYLTILKESKWVVSAAIGSGILIVVVGLLVMQYLTHTSPQDPRFKLALVLGWGLTLGTGLWLPITCGTLLWKILHNKREREKNLVNALHYLIRRSYLIFFELVPPEGKNRLDRLFNHLSLVFPEIQEISKKWKKKGVTPSVWNEKRRYRKAMAFLKNYDFVLRTKTGFFVIKFFNKKTTFQDIEDNIRGLNMQKFFGLEISRVIFISNEFDPIFENDDLVNKMQKLKRKFKSDLILEDGDYGYSTIWIDR